jgi:hypothetical protein
MLRSHLRVALVILSVLGFFASASLSRSQEAQSQSVAEAAQRAKEAKKKASAKSKVITDDDLDATKVKPGEQGLTTATPQLETGPPPASAVAAAEAADAVREKSPADAPVEKGDKPEVVRLKAELARAEQDLDLTQREAALAQDSFYSRPDHARDAAGKGKIDALQQQITEKQKSVQDLRDRLAAMGVSLKSAGSAAGSTPPAPAPPQS